MAATVAAAPARSEPSAATVLEQIDKGDLMARMIVYGYSNGYDWANTELRDKKRAQLFCIPDKLVITPDQNTQILRDYVTAHPDMRTFPAGMVLLYAYIDTFPCGSK
jgi:hypothetical protein